MIPIAEIFGPTIQGEGGVIGMPSIFVRVGGCDYRCSWCDSLHAVDPQYKESWVKLTPSAIVASCAALAKGVPYLITLTGGNPALYNFDDVILEGWEKFDFSFCCETQGSKWADWFDMLALLTISPKPPSAGMAFDREAFERCFDATCDKVVKVAIFNEQDYYFARSLKDFCRERDAPLFLTVGTDQMSMPADLLRADIAASFDQIAQWIYRDGWTSTALLPQLHTMIWPHEQKR